MLIQTEKRSLRCAMWEDYTPNELMKSSAEYRNIIKKWAKESQISKTNRLFEVRIVRQQSELEIHKSSAWWDDPMWMDMLFWVYQTPVKLYPEGEKGPSFSCYALEFYECQRIMNAAIVKFGYNPFQKRDEYGNVTRDDQPSLLIPTDCVEVEWNETKGGYADNLREGAIERAEKPLTQEEQELEAEADEAVKKLSEDIYDVSGDVRWNNDK